MLSPVVWVVSADHWPRACLRAELIERGYDAVGFVILKEAVLRLILPRSSRPSLLVIDLHGQVVETSMRRALLRERVPVLAIADAIHSAPETTVPSVAVLRRPLTIGAIADVVDHLIGQRRTMGTLTEGSGR